MVLYIQKEYTFTIANYGVIPYGRTVIGNLHLASPSDGCSLIKNPQVEEQLIFLIERGNCSFYTKSQFAQLGGAKMLIVLDDVYEDEKKLLVQKNSSEGNQNSQVNIPTVMIDKKSGMLLKDYLNKNKNETITVSFEFHLKSDYDGILRMEYWYQGTNEQSLEFLEKFSKNAKNILQDKNFVFKPRHVTWRCYFCELFPFLLWNKECISNGKYCANTPKNSKNKGEDVVMEDVRQICIFQEYPTNFFEYISEFRKTCLNNTSMSLQTCSYSILETFGPMKKENIDSCVNKSFTTNDKEKSDNTLLSLEKKNYDEKGIKFFPIIFINDDEYRVDFYNKGGSFQFGSRFLYNLQFKQKP